MAERVSKDRVSGAQHPVSPRIFRAYFRKRAHSVVVGSLLKVFRIKSLKKERKGRVGGTLTMHPSSTQTSPGKDLSNGCSRFCSAHNASNAGSSKLLQQQAKATAVPFPPDPTSSQAMRLKISSTLRQGCIESRRRDWLSAGDMLIK